VTPPATGRDALLQRAVEHFAVHGVGDTSLRAVAEAIGTSHRMLIYHFGSREGLLAAVVDAVERGARETLARMVEEAADDPDALGAGHPHAAALRSSLVTTWLDALTAMWRRRGVPARQAREQSRLDLAVARGLLHDLLLTGDRRGVDAAMTHYARETVTRLIG
jgi:AcrR family transcriptional regulator